MKKSDVQFHSDGFGRAGKPAVNVKVRTSRHEIKFPLGLGSYCDCRALGHEDQENPKHAFVSFYTDPRFDWDWIDKHAPDSDGFYFGEACRQGFEQAEELAQELFGKHVKVYSEGRSGGWLVIDGLDSFESWSAPMLAKWAKFEKTCEELTAGVLEQTVLNIYYNAFERWAEEQEQARTEEMTLNLL